MSTYGGSPQIMEQWMGVPVLVVIRLAGRIKRRSESKQGRRQAAPPNDATLSMMERMQKEIEERGTSPTGSSKP